MVSTETESVSSVSLPSASVALFSEPWSVVNNEPVSHTINRSDGTRICVVAHRTYGRVDDETASAEVARRAAVARRIVACVNACKGVPTQALECVYFCPTPGNPPAGLLPYVASMVESLQLGDFSYRDKRAVIEVVRLLVGPRDSVEYTDWERDQMIPPLDLESSYFGDEPWRAFAKGGILAGFAELPQADPVVARIVDATGAFAHYGVLEDGRYAAFDAAEEDAVCYVETPESARRRKAGA